MIVEEYNASCAIRLLPAVRAATRTLMKSSIALSFSKLRKGYRKTKCRRRGERFHSDYDVQNLDEFHFESFT